MSKNELYPHVITYSLGHCCYTLFIEQERKYPHVITDSCGHCCYTLLMRGCYYALFLCISI